MLLSLAPFLAMPWRLAFIRRRWCFRAIGCFHPSGPSIPNITIHRSIKPVKILPAQKKLHFLPHLAGLSTQTSSSNPNIQNISTIHSRIQLPGGGGPWRALGICQLTEDHRQAGTRVPRLAQDSRQAELTFALAERNH
ncbi:hypothetical protein PtA15_12A125 [Puccinia triticina]|uniref:Uncharacterized protein n=1 Tax=Puccinia triticina TaxID=208348 RepID=A0ABY7CXW2_9BASI|nr:uncharacterized protein PtA15_12A125 [Puccinia triticina]WAQ90139.1 hypothetical protein PtA15_12A125 [Puccinia triticina]WAR61426.1 hypothetical protein PtB15_12B111 [Puccinia triticina]